MSSYCSVCNVPAAKVCQRCKITKYCSRECQCKDWPKHKLICKIEFKARDMLTAARRDLEAAIAAIPGDSDIYPKLQILLDKQKWLETLDYENPSIETLNAIEEVKTYRQENTNIDETYQNPYYEQYCSKMMQIKLRTSARIFTAGNIIGLLNSALGDHRES